MSEEKQPKNRKDASDLMDSALAVIFYSFRGMDEELWPAPAKPLMEVLQYYNDAWRNQDATLLRIAPEVIKNIENALSPLRSIGEDELQNPCDPDLYNNIQRALERFDNAVEAIKAEQDQSNRLKRFIKAGPKGDIGLN